MSLFVNEFISFLYQIFFFLCVAINKARPLAFKKQIKKK
jgi:hypothetical protein